MIAMLSPARNTRQPEGQTPPTTRPLFIKETARLVQALRTYSPWQLESLLDVPPQRAIDLYDAYQAFDPKAPGTPALLTYLGAAYRNMAPGDFDEADLAFAQDHLRVFSALYGMLRPLDGILPHRLGLKKEFNPGGRDLYAFWGGKLHKALYQTGQLVANLASMEYARLVTPHMRAGDKMLTCRFLVDKPGGPRATVSTVRAARGLMARFIVLNRIDDPEGLKDFDTDGYRFAPVLSRPEELVFVKNSQAFAKYFV